MTADNDTIVAIGTAGGAGGIGIVRVSGPLAPAIAQTLIARRPRARRAEFASFRAANGETLDSGIALFFPGPRSFTGEDVLELHAHGSPVVLALLVSRCIALGARAARAGEFSERAFLNGKLDLAQAEAIADLIAASSEAQARAAQRSLAGAFSRRVHDLLLALVHLRSYVEAAIDFPEEEIDFLGDARVLEELHALRARVDETLIEARRGQRLRDGLHVVIAGRPNAGKSSLLNALAGDERAIVTAIPGTTRDVLREVVRFEGVEITLVDTAGLRDTGDPVETEGVRRARAELARADLALLLVDASADAAQREADAAALAAECEPSCARLWVYTKIDRLSEEDKSRLAPLPQYGAAAVVGAASAAIAACGPDDAVQSFLLLSVHTGSGLDTLRAMLKARTGASEAGTGAFSARARHVEALARVAAHLAEGETQLTHARAGELLAEELRQAQHALSEITGEYSSDDLLGAIFSSFCIGK